MKILRKKCNFTYLGLAAALAAWYNETQNVWALQNMSAVLRHNSIETGNGGVINECKRRRRAAFMRSEKEMMDTIIEVAEKDARIRGVYMNGSRTNPNAPRDVFQDYDIVYVRSEERV